mgnify:CR=1 FL=1
MNPFKKNNEITPNASINSVYIDDVLASDLFRPSIIIEEIKKNFNILSIESNTDEDKILLEFNDKLSCDDINIKTIANDLAISFGDNLAKVVLTLIKPSQKSIINRNNWETIHWDYWKNIKKIYFVGGLTSPILTSIFYQRISKMLLENNIFDLNISFIEGSSDLGTKGLTYLIENGEYLLFDFGQTYIKRRFYVKDNEETKIDLVLSPLKSKFLFYKEKNTQQIKDLAYRLDMYVIDVILDSINEVDFNGNDIIIGLANYIHKGKIYSARGGYGKLAYVDDNYQSYLSNVISNKLGRKISVLLYHDTSAMALNFKNEENCAVISLGTAFGIGFPE